jgi:hypothetical protein
MRHTLRPLVIAATVTLVACHGGSTEPLPDVDAARAASEFEHVADSLMTAGSDVAVVDAYRGLASAVRIGHPSPVTIMIDGSPHEFLALARDIDWERTGACAEPGSLCLMAPPLRSMIAWDRSTPRRVVQLTATPGGMPIGMLYPGTSMGPFLNTATLTYFDGAGGMYVGTDGAQSITDPVRSTTPCFTTNYPTFAPGGTCVLADFVVSFAGTVAPPPVTIARNTATGTHTLAMSSQPVSGSSVVLSGSCTLCAGNGYPPGWLPPINLMGIMLPSQLSASVAPGGVTLTFTVLNPGTAPVELHFTSGQQYEFRIRTAAGAPVWTWSANKSFTAALSSRTLGPNESLTYVERWSPALPGSYVALGSLVSSSHHAEAAAAFVVP